MCVYYNGWSLYTKTVGLFGDVGSRYSQMSGADSLKMSGADIPEMFGADSQQ